MSFLDAFWAESMKVRHAVIFWISLAAACVFPILFALIAAGTIGTNMPVPVQSNLTWFTAQLELLIAVGGLIGFGFVFSWIFGREYSDGTVTDLLALPVSREHIVSAKLAVGAVWCGMLAVLVYGVGCLVIKLLHLDGVNLGAVVHSFWKYGFNTLMVISLSVPAAFIASIGRGYLSPLGFVILTIVIAQLSSIFGVDIYFPWAIPGLFSGAAGEATFAKLGMFNLILPFLMGLVGSVAVLIWWRYADHT